MVGLPQDRRGDNPFAKASHDKRDGRSWRLARDVAGEAEARDETLFTLSDGWLGVRAGLEERPGHSGSAFLADAYERYPIDYHERFPGFARTTDTRVPVADGKRVVVRLGEAGEDLAAGRALRTCRTLDLTTGLLVRTTDWRAPDGSSLKVTAERVASFRRPGLYPLRFALESVDFKGAVALEGAIETEQRAAAKGDDPRLGVAAHSLPLIGQRRDGEVSITVQAIESRELAVLCGQLVKSTLPIHVGATEMPCAHGHLAPGGRAVLEKFVAYQLTDNNQAAITAAAQTLSGRLREAAALGFDALAAEQCDELSAFWDGAALSIDGAPELEQALRLNLFQLRQSADASGRFGLAAKGLSGEGYEGHVFWDAEAFMLPVLVHVQPALARAHLEYRCATLAAARAHAAEMNFTRGALYPWRTIGGGECSAYFPAGSAQLHINAAIGRAIGLYLSATDDLEFVAAHAGEVLFETARIWLEAGAYDPRRGNAFTIHTVTGPDEYTALVDNNYYTNLMARAHLRLAADIAARLEAERPGNFAALAGHIALTPAEREDWRRAAEAMYLPYDRVLGVTAQDDAFLSRPPFDFEAAANKRPLLLHYHPLTLYRHQVCKQADVVLAHVFEGHDVSLEQKRRDFDYYEPITTHDSTLSASTHAILATEVCAEEAALGFFRETALVDLEDLHHNTAHGAHMAAMAGSWLALIYGYGGLRVQDGTLRFRPTLPKAWQGFSARLCWQGRVLEIAIRRQTAEYRLLAGAPLDIEHEGARLHLEAGAPVRCAWGHGLPLEAVIFDLDGVLTDTAMMHFRAWKRLADELGIGFDERANEKLKGLDRMASLEALLDLSGTRLNAAEKARLAARKNGFYLEEIAGLGPADLLPGARAALERAHADGLKTALASASRNAPQIVAQLGIAELFDAIADAAAVPRGKPAPDLFLSAAARLGVLPTRCLALEDSAAGVAAIKAAGMCAIGVGDPQILGAADTVIADLTVFEIRRPEEPRCTQETTPTA